MSALSLTVRIERWPLAKPFAISRGVKTEAIVLVAEVGDGTHTGHGEAVPYPRYGETPEDCLALLTTLGRSIAADAASQLPPGAARNALDCALLDLAAKQAGKRIWQLLDGLEPPVPALTAYTISLGTPGEMAAAAREAAHRPLLKVKLGAEDPVARMKAVAAAAPNARLIADANEGWDIQTLKAVAPTLADLGTALIEQPLPADRDADLEGYTCPVPLCADESCHGLDDLPRLQNLFHVVNIKLDKTGGLTGAIKLAHATRAQGLGIMVGCMVGTSLAMAPALMLAPFADFVDLDGPLLLAKDREPGLTFDGATILPPEPALWG